MEQKFTKPIYLTDTFTSGKGTAHYPNATTPDTKFKVDGELTCDIILPGDRLPAIKRAYSKAKAEWANLRDAKGVPIKSKKIADTPWDELDDGTIKVRIRRTAKTAKGTSVRIKIVDGRKQALSGPESEFGHGSIINVGFRARAWYTPLLGFGVSFMPEVVQLIEARFEGGVSVDDFEFDDEGDDDEGDDDALFDTNETQDGSDSEDF